jgi:hypothetical protein
MRMERYRCGVELKAYHDGQVINAIQLLNIISCHVISCHIWDRGKAGKGFEVE